MVITNRFTRVVVRKFIPDLKSKIRKSYIDRIDLLEIDSKIKNLIREAYSSLKMHADERFIRS